MAWTIAQLNDPDLAVRLANRIAFSEDPAYEKYDVTMLGTWDDSLPRSVNPKMIKDYIFINDTVVSLNPDVDCDPCDIPSAGCCPETNTLLSEIKDILDGQSDNEYQETFMIQPSTGEIAIREVVTVDGVVTVSYKNLDGTAYTGVFNTLIPYMTTTPSKIAEHFEVVGTGSKTLTPNTYESISFTVIEGKFDVSVNGSVITYEAGVYPSITWDGKPRISSEFIFTGLGADSKIIINTMK